MAPIGGAGRACGVLAHEHLQVANAPRDYVRARVAAPTNNLLANGVRHPAEQAPWYESDSYGSKADLFVSQDLANALAVSRYYDVSGSGGAGRPAVASPAYWFTQLGAVDYFYRPFALRLTSGIAGLSSTLRTGQLCSCHADIARIARKTRL